MYNPYLRLLSSKEHGRVRCRNRLPHVYKYKNTDICINTGICISKCMYNPYLRPLASKAHGRVKSTVKDHRLRYMMHLYTSRNRNLSQPSIHFNAHGEIGILILVKITRI